ncbi:craniofacial development protein 2-like [Elysia marginata]|uniref:Craniofacial development protein 2-like n=1 Tax=Elysia marginata TaxID=1093978 RepID=A0AAV4H6U5_9GAST|nr:craniofacial development protein 2-like [Elysia marginata]
MDRNKKDKSCVSEAGPPTVELAVNKNREEVSSLASTALPDGAPAPNPTLGRPRADCGSLKTRHRNFNIATWNVRTLFQCGKFENLVKEAELLKLDICGVSETRWTKSGHIDSENYRFVYSGSESHEHGVGLLISKKLTMHMLGYLPVSKRNIVIKIQASPFNLAILQTYAPTSDYSDEDIDKYYEEVQDVLKEAKSSEVLIVMGDMNAKVGNQKLENIVGQHGLGKINDRGVKLTQFCSEYDLCIINTFFQHPLRRTYTWKSPGDRRRNQIDYIMIKLRFKNSVKQCKTYPGADIESDHAPVVAKIQIKLKKLKKPKNHFFMPIY